MLKALENLRSLLAPEGRLVVTIPLGYNPSLNRMIDEGRTSFAERAYLKRNPSRNIWREVRAEEARNPHYDRQAYAPHKLLVGIMENR